MAAPGVNRTRGIISVKEKDTVYSWEKEGENEVRKKEEKKKGNLSYLWWVIVEHYGIELEELELQL